jgi:hypothetical protein
MGHSERPHDLELAWDEAAERARAQQAFRQELGDGLLDEAAGLHVQSGVQAGAWSSTCSGDFTCGCRT